MERKSAWTGRRGVRLVEVRVPSMTRWGTPRGERELLVEPEHAEELRSFAAYAVRYGRTALFSFLACSLVALVGSLFATSSPAARWLITASLMALGVLVLVFPFSTPETVAMMGMRRSRQLARGAGVLVLALALVDVAAQVFG